MRAGSGKRRNSGKVERRAGTPVKIKTRPAPIHHRKAHCSTDMKCSVWLDGLFLFLPLRLLEKKMAEDSLTATSDFLSPNLTNH